MLKGKKSNRVPRRLLKALRSPYVSKMTKMGVNATRGEISIVNGGLG